MKNTQPKKYIIMCSVLVVSLIVITMSITYAYFLSSIGRDFTESSIETGTFEIKTSLSNMNALNVSNMNILNEDEIDDNAQKLDFTVQSLSKNSNNKPGKFNVYLKNVLISDDLIDSDFKWDLIKEGEIIATGNFADIVTEGVLSSSDSVNSTKTYSTYYLKKDIDFEDYEENNLTIRVYLLNDAVKDQSKFIEKSFECNVAVEAYNAK